MNPLEKRIKTLQADIEAALKRLNIVAKNSELAALETELADPEVWNDSTHAQEVSKAAAN